MWRHRPVVIAVAVCVVILAGLATFAVAQPGVPGGYPQGGGRGPGMGGQQARPAAIAVTAQAVFVVSGSRLYKFDADTLELIAHTEIPAPEPPAGLPQQ